MKTRLLAFVLVLMGWCGAAAAAPVLHIEGNILVGASGVNVNGTFYDVSFRDGTCIELYSGCDEAADFPFVGSAALIAASQALLDQVFLDGSLGDFDTRPSLTRGCGDNTGQGFCSVFTPADTLVNNVLARNSTADSFDAVLAAFTLPGESLLPYDTVVYAVWAPLAVPVPEPSAAQLLGIGLAAAALLRCRARRRSA